MHPSFISIFVCFCDLILAIIVIRTRKYVCRFPCQSHFTLSSQFHCQVFFFFASVSQTAHISCKCACGICDRRLNTPANQEWRINLLILVLLAYTVNTTWLAILTRHSAPKLHNMYIIILLLKIGISYFAYAWPAGRSAIENPEIISSVIEPIVLSANPCLCYVFPIWLALIAISLSILFDSDSDFECIYIIILIIANKRKNDETFVIFIVFA